MLNGTPSFVHEVNSQTRLPFTRTLFLFIPVPSFPSECPFPGLYLVIMAASKELLCSFEHFGGLMMFSTGASMPGIAKEISI